MKNCFFLTTILFSLAYTPIYGVSTPHPAEAISKSEDWIEDFRRNMPPLPLDPLSNARPDLAIIKELVWEIEHLDFEHKQLFAKATYLYENKTSDNEELIFDIKDLEISRILINNIEIDRALYSITSSTMEGKPDALRLPIPKKLMEGTVSIEYKTSPNASGIFWIDKEFTEEKKHPLVYTLFQPNEGASVLPGQHSPQVRVSYEIHAKTNGPNQIFLSSVSNNPTKLSSDGMYRGLKMDRPVPLYLLSLVAGEEIVFHPFDEKTGVYAERSILPKAIQAFEKLPEYLLAAEEVCGPYKWGTYRVVLLGKGFPFMAMEHPCASTCGIVCLDHPNVIPHELSHSWTGNEISNCNWFQFFWNEGWTTFIEHAICEKIWGTEYAHLNFLLTFGDTLSDIEEHKEKNPDLLRLCMQGPIFTLTTVPYGKGALFFFMLQKAIGKDSFSLFIKDYMKTFSGESMSDLRFLAFLKTWLEHRLGQVDFEQFKQDHQINEWLYEADIPSNAPIPASSLFDAICDQTNNFLSGKDFDIRSILKDSIYPDLIFLERLKGKVSIEQLKKLDQRFDYTHSSSLSLLGQWVLLVASTSYFTEETKKMIYDYLLIRNSIYETAKITSELVKTKEGRDLAQEILEKGSRELFPLNIKAIQSQLNSESL